MGNSLYSLPFSAIGIDSFPINLNSTYSIGLSAYINQNKYYLIL